MKFQGNGIVWDAERERTLCEFKGGKFETDDLITATILKDRGYEHD